jgi:hypothetical protein
MGSETYEFIRSIAIGEEVSRWDYPDPLIYDVRLSEPRTSTKIVITFDRDDDFLDVMGVEDENDRWAWSRYKGSYNNEFDGYRYEQDWEEGYLIRHFDESNIDLVNQILKYTKPGFVYSEDDDIRKEISTFLSQTFSNEINDIIYEYGVLDWDCILKSITKIMDDETSNPFMRLGIVEKSHAYKYETTVGILLSLFKMFKVEDDDLKELLKKVDQKLNSKVSRGNWYELEYNTYCDDFDNETFQYETKRILEKLLEKIEEDLTDNVDFEEFNKLYDVVISLGGFNKFIHMKEKGIQLVFENLDPETNTLIFKVYKGNNKFERRSVDNLEDLNLQLYHPELFESIRKILKKLL